MGRNFRMGSLFMSSLLFFLSLPLHHPPYFTAFFFLTLPPTPPLHTPTPRCMAAASMRPFDAALACLKNSLDGGAGGGPLTVTNSLFQVVRVFCVSSKLGGPLVTSEDFCRRRLFFSRSPRGSTLSTTLPKLNPGHCGHYQLPSRKIVHRNWCGGGGRQKAAERGGEGEGEPPGGEVNGGGEWEGDDAGLLFSHRNAHPGGFHSPSLAY